MPIGGSAYYDKFKKTPGQKSVRPAAPVEVKPIVAASVPAVVAAAKLAPARHKALVKTSHALGRRARPTVSVRDRSVGAATMPLAETAELGEVVAQIMDLAQRVQAVAGQAEAAVLRAEAAVLKSEIAVARAEGAGQRADAFAVKCQTAIGKAEAAVYKSESSAKRAELSANKAGMAAGKSEQASVARAAVNIVSDGPGLLKTVANAGSIGPKFGSREDNQQREQNGPISQIAVMSMKLRSGMRQIEEASIEPGAEAEVVRPAPNYNLSLGRDRLASGLVSLDNDTALPRVAPFIMDDNSQASAAWDNATEDDSDALTRGRERSSVSSAA